MFCSLKLLHCVLLWVCVCWHLLPHTHPLESVSSVSASLLPAKCFYQQQQSTYSEKLQSNPINAVAALHVAIHVFTFIKSHPSNRKIMKSLPSFLPWRRSCCWGNVRKFYNVSVLFSFLFYLSINATNQNSFQSNSKYFQQNTHEYVFYRFYEASSVQHETGWTFRKLIHSHYQHWT